jgi:hypothetical protein
LPAGTSFWPLATPNRMPAALLGQAGAPLALAAGPIAAVAETRRLSAINPVFGRRRPGGIMGRVITELP